MPHHNDQKADAIMEPMTQMPNDGNEISFKELLENIWRRRILIAAITLLFTLSSAIAAWVVPKTYRASIVISPSSDNSGSQLNGLSSLASQFGGLASMAGISLSNDSKKAESLAVLQSEALTEQYIDDHHLLPLLYAKYWDKQTGTWTTNPSETPTLWKANQLFKRDVREVNTDTKTGLVTLTISWKDPTIAAKWANDLVKMANEYLRNKAVDQSERNITYLNEQVAKTDAVGVKQAIYSILQTEINKAMLARGNNEYAFKVIDPAVPPEKASSPQKILWIVMGLFSGLFVSGLATLVLTASRP